MLDSTGWYRRSPRDLLRTVNDFVGHPDHSLIRGHSGYCAEAIDRRLALLASRIEMRLHLSPLLVRREIADKIGPESSSEVLRIGFMSRPAQSASICVLR